jgi:hypothetical protein
VLEGQAVGGVELKGDPYAGAWAELLGIGRQRLGDYLDADGSPRRRAGGRGSTTTSMVEQVAWSGSATT